MQKKIFLGDYSPNIIKNCLTVNAVRQFCLFSYTNNQLKTVQKIEHNLACMDYAKIFCL